jgi:hypothetical protein
VIGAAHRATGATEKDRAALEAIVIGLDTSWDRSPGLRAFDHNHPHARLPRIIFLLQAKTGRLDDASCRCGDLGGEHRSVVWSSVGGLLGGRAFLQPAGSLLEGTLTGIWAFNGMIRKSVPRFSEKIMLNRTATAR